MTTKYFVKNKRGLRCSCCGRVMKCGYKSVVTLNIFTCRYCWNHCEGITGRPYCHFERKEIGGYWSDGRSNKFTRFDEKEETRNQKEYFEDRIWVR